ncbi:MAG: YceI family protein [Saprospiraceae bacterium]|nr:YceI family protein [Saprospiraceae bacterium]
MRFGILLLLTLSLLSTDLVAQKWFTRDGKISFFSEAPLEKIEAENSSGTSVLDAESGRIEFAVLIKGFQFESALMQEHFNENYMDSDKFPKSTFKGYIEDPETILWDQDGEYEVSVKGDLTIHGVTKEVSVPASFSMKEGSLSGNCTFVVAVADYDIKIPKLVRENIAKEVEISVQSDYKIFQ